MLTSMVCFQVEEVKKMKIGDPLDTDTNHGPQNHRYFPMFTRIIISCYEPLLPLLACAFLGHHVSPVKPSQVSVSVCPSVCMAVSGQEDRCSLVLLVDCLSNNLFCISVCWDELGSFVSLFAHTYAAVKAVFHMNLA